MSTAAHAAAQRDTAGRSFAPPAGVWITTICAAVFEHHAGVQVRNRKIAVANLERIVEATLTIANRKGFAAMSLRELARRSGLSLGGLYAYFRSKSELVAMIQRHGHQAIKGALAEHVAGLEEPSQRLAAAIQGHVMLSTTLRPWFRFLYLEARHLAPAGRRAALAMEQDTEALFADIIRAGQATGAFREEDATLAAGMLKALLQDWYLKPGKHSERGLTATGYADSVFALMMRYLQDSP